MAMDGAAKSSWTIGDDACHKSFCESRIHDCFSSVVSNEIEPIIL
eukprot:COSAG02_NODE_6903_length_3297_cov_18.176986_3_plen_45_part_00